MSHEHDDPRTPAGGPSEPLDPETADRLRALPRAIEPERDLWPGIAARLERPAAASGPPRRWRYWQLAAAAALVAALAGTGFGLLRLLGPEGEPSGPARTAAGGTAEQDGSPARVPHDSAATSGGEPAAASAMPGTGTFGGRLLAALERKRNRLGPETSDAVEADIARLGLAVAEILTALAEHPDDPALYHHLAARQRQEADLLLRLNRL